MSNLQVIGVGGVPGVGKTTVMYEILDLLGPAWAEFKMGLCRGNAFSVESVLKNVFVLGVYDGSLFSGTDKLSMAAQPDAIKFVQWAAKLDFRTVVLFEGDRLFTGSFLEACFAAAPGSKFIALRANAAALEERRTGRKLKQQNAQWIRGRETKVGRIVVKFGLERHEIDTADDSTRLAETLVSATTTWVRDANGAGLSLPVRRAQP